MLSAAAAERHTPTVSRKPGVGQGRLTECSCTRAGIEGEKVAFNTGGIYKKMAGSATYGYQSVRMGYKATTADTLVGPFPIAADCVQGRMKGAHY
jgi:hypothetical protein